MDDPTSPDPVPTSQLRMRLAPNCAAHVMFAGPVTREAIELLIELLEVCKRAYPAAAQESKGK